MRLSRAASVSVAILLVSSVSAQHAHATPFFARTYHMGCESCHSGPPRLNAFGLAFKANNFRLPAAEKSPLAWEKTIPLSVQVEPTWSVTNPGDKKNQFTDTQILAGGLLGQHTAFFAHDSRYFDGKPVTVFPNQEFWLQQALDDYRQVMLKLGQFELPLAYSPVINRPSISTPFALFTARMKGNDVSLGGTMDGVQISGRERHELRWYVAGGAPSANSPGIVVGERQFLGRFRDLFARVSYGPLDRQVGVFYYRTEPPRSRTDPTSGDSARRYGIDALWFVHGTQLYAQAMYGEDADPTGTHHAGTMRTAFLEAERPLRRWLSVFGRLDVLSQSDGVTPSWRQAETLGLRFYPHPLVRLIAEFQALDHARNSVGLMGGVIF